MNKTYISSNLEIVEMDNEWIIMDTDNYTITKVNEIGACILEGIQAGKSLDEIVHLITISYDADPFTVKPDVVSFLEQLNTLGLVAYGSK